MDCPFCPRPCNIYNCALYSIKESLRSIAMQMDAERRGKVEAIIAFSEGVGKAILNSDGFKKAVEEKEDKSSTTPA